MVNISANYITACNDQNHGCNGGYMEFVYEFLKSGVITGGDYESDEVSDCKKLQFIYNFFAFSSDETCMAR